MCNTSWDLSHWKIRDNQTKSKRAFDDIKVVFLTKEWNSFHFSGMKLDYLHLKDFLKYECELYQRHLLSPPQDKIIVTYCTLKSRLAIEIGWWMTITISRDTRLYHLFSYNAGENEASFVLECPLYNAIRNRFPSPFENVVPRGLKSFFQIDHQAWC